MLMALQALYLPTNNFIIHVCKQITKESSKVTKIAVGVLLGIMIFGMFIVGYDQGHLFNLAQGDQAFDTMWMHEFYHDMGHSAGFPCH
jgi:hypothetical protein